MKNILIILIIIVLINMIPVIPSFSVSDGEHTFYNGQNSCLKCHKDKQSVVELCTNCHQKTSEAHAASIKICKDCHTTPADTHHLMLSQRRTTLGCTDCHPIVSNQVIIEMNCLSCHGGYSFWANNKINLTKPDHHN